LKRVTALENANNVDSLIKATKNRVREELKSGIDSLLILYNANVQKYKGLSWLGNDYPYQISHARDLLVERERIALNRPDINLSRLYGEILIGDQSNFLHSARLALEKEESTFAHHVTGDSSE